MLSYFTGLQHIRPDVNSINLNRAKVVIPLYEKDFSNLRLAVLSIKPVYGTDYCYQKAFNPFTINFMTRVHDDTDQDGYAKKLATGERIYRLHDRASKNIPKCVAKPTETSLAHVLTLKEEDFGRLTKDARFNAHIGSFFSALNNLGYVMYQDGTYSEFPNHCSRYMPPFVITKIEEIIKLDKSFEMPKMFQMSAFAREGTIKSVTVNG